MEMGLMRVFGGDHHYWRMVERDAETPWFCLTMHFRNKSRIKERTAMPDDYYLVEQILSQQNDHMQVIDLQVMTPESMNHKGRWLLEPLSKLQLAQTACGTTVEIYTTLDGSVYFNPSQRPRAIKNLRITSTPYSREDALAL